MTDTAVDELLSVCACDLGVELLTLTGTYYIRKPSIHALSSQICSKDRL